MRTVDPYLWSKKVRKPPLNVSRPFRFGLKGLSRFEVGLRKSFRDAMLEFYKNCSVEGVAFIRDKSNPKPLRWCYLAVLMVSMTCGLALIVYNIMWFWSMPRLTMTALPVQHPVQHIDFPAIAVCSNNLISRSSLNTYAQLLYSLDKNKTYTLEGIKKNLLAFGALHSRENFEYGFRFLSYLDKVVHFTNITHILYQLTPDCMKMLVRCGWQARRVHCERIFAKRITNAGFCCVFNARYHPMDRNNSIHKASLVGQDSGLTVVVRENPDDVTSVRQVHDGFDVFIFDGWEYPVLSSGVMSVVPVAHSAAVFVRLRARSVRAADSLLRHSDEWLGCRMRRGGEAVGQWSHCVGACRSAAARALCLCAPHTLPPLRRGTLHCSLEHLACLSKHTDKLLTLYPGDDVHASLSAEQADSVECAQCRADCSRQRYSAAATTVPYALLQRDIFLNRVLKGVDLTNTSIVQIFYTSGDQELYIMETTFRWFEILVHMNSQLVFVVGMLVVGALELFYHCTLRWRHHYRRLDKLRA